VLDPNEKTTTTPKRLETRLAENTADSTFSGLNFVIFQKTRLSIATAITRATAEDVIYDTVG
jgi:hypothetical protein